MAVVVHSDLRRLVIEDVVPNAGDPIQRDELVIEHDQGEVEIVVYNRAILLFTTDSEVVRRIHQVCFRLDDIARSRRPA